MSSEQEIFQEIDQRNSQILSSLQTPLGISQKQEVENHQKKIEISKDDQIDQKNFDQIQNLTLTDQVTTFLTSILKSDYFQKQQQECSQIIQIILSRKFGDLNNYFSNDETDYFFNIVRKNKQFAYLCEQVRNQKCSFQLNVEQILKQLKIKSTIKQECEKLLKQRNIEKFKLLINDKQKKKLSQILMKDQFVIIENQEQNMEKSKKQYQKLPQPNSKNCLQQIINNILSSDLQINIRIWRVIKQLVDLFTFPEKCDQIQLKWSQLMPEQKLAEFQLVQTFNSNKIQPQQSNFLAEIIKNCQLLLFISLNQEILNHSKVNANKRNQKQQSFITFSNKLLQRIDKITKSNQFCLKLKQKNNSQTKYNFIEENISKLQKEQLRNILNQYINQKSCELYLKTKIKVYRFFYNHSQIEISANNRQILQKVKQLTNSKLQQLIIFTKKQECNSSYIPCDADFLFIGNQFKLFMKQSIFITCNGIRNKSEISKDLSVKELKKLIIHNINKKQEKQLIEEKVRLNFQFQQKYSRVIDQNQQVFQLQREFGTLSGILVELMINVTLYYDGDQYKFNLWQKEPIVNLKNHIKERLLIPVESQILQIQKNNVVNQIESKQTLEHKKMYDSDIDMTLILKSNLQFYGFHQNISLKYEKFKEFLIQKIQIRHNFLKSCNLRQNKENIFFEKTIPYIFSALKKRLDLQSIIKMFRIQVSDYTKQEIWTSSRQINTFNPTFLLYYILYNSESKLRIQIMNLVKHTMPLPLYFREFSSINSISDNWSINQQLIWILKNEFSIISLGFHTQNIQLQKGKSQLLNKIFYTNFAKSQTKHGIASCCPEISLKIYGNIYNANLIDIGSRVPSQTSDKILSKASFVILHSWRNYNQTLEQVQRIKGLVGKDKYVLIIMRDISIDSKDNWLQNTKQLVEDKIQLYNLSLKIDPISIQILIKKVKKLVHQKIKSEILQCKPLVPLIQTSNQTFIQLQKILNSIKGIVTSFKNVSLLYKQYQFKYPQSSNLQKMISQNLGKFKLHSQIENLINFISKHQNETDLIIQRVKDKLKFYKEEVQQKYKILIYAKRDIDGILDQQSQQYKDKIKFYKDIILSLKEIPKFQTDSRANILKGLANAIQHFHNNIKPEILSLELLWRELFLLTQINPNYSLGNQLLIDFIIQIHKKQVFNNQPFELIDGDSLKMPKSVIKKIFDSTKGTAATIIILGPQSSGKSTLLNYLFGCDFKTSEGRCTRGVYGTYYNISNNSMFSCSSIFLIDTEGLLAITNQKDEKVREDFDSKLILFCLAVADFVIVNTKSDLDSQTMGKLQACKQRLPTLSQGSNPQFWLVMNQSQTSDMKNKVNDVNRMQGLFDLGNSRCLSQAFDTIVLGKQQICILDQDVMLKKKSKSDFEVLTLKLQNDLMQRVSKKNYRCIPEIIDKMQVIWSTIEKYPDLGKNYSEQIKEIDNRINKWKQQYAEKLNSVKDQLLLKFEQSIKNQSEIQSEFNVNKTEFEDQFEKHFFSKDNTQAVNERIKQKIKVIVEEFDYVFKKLKFGIQDFKMKKKFKIQQQQGNVDIKTQIKRIKHLQLTEPKHISDQQKSQCFEKIFQKITQKLKNSINLQKQMKDQFQRVKDYYQSHIKQVSFSSTQGYAKIMLPRLQKQLNLTNSYQQERSQILKVLQQQKNYKMILQYSNHPHTNVLVGGKTDASLKYFDMNNYFQKVENTFYLTIPQKNIQYAIRKSDFINYVRNSYKIQKQKSNNSPLLAICQQINRSLSYYGLKFKSLEQLGDKIQNVFKDKSFFEILADQIKTLFKASDDSCPILIELQKQQIPRNFQPSNFFNHSCFSIYYYQIKPQKKKKHLNHISCKIMKDCINLYQIQMYIDSSKHNLKLKQNLISKLSRQIQNQLAVIGIIIKAHQFVRNVLQTNQFENYKTPEIIITNIIPIQVSSAQKFFLQVKKLIWINEKTIRLYLSQKDHIPENNYFALAYFKKQILLPKKEANKFNVGRYLNEQNAEVMKYLKSQQTIDFLWQQFRNKSVFIKLFDQLDIFIENICSKKLPLAKTVQQIFSKVVKQIGILNDDINQLSYKLTFNFQGFCHMYVVRMIWKQLCKKQQGLLSKRVEDWIQQKQKHYKYFLKMTSNKIEQISDGEVQNFLNNFFDNFELNVNKIKQTIVKEEILLFKKTNTRQSIQYQIDRDTFKIGAKKQNMIQYIENPKQKVQQRYRQAVQESIKNINLKLKKQTYHTKLFRQFEESILIIQNKLQSTYNVLESQGTFDYFFTASSKTDKQITLIDQSVSSESSIIFMNYFIDCMFQRNKLQYQCDKFTAILKQDKANYTFQTCQNSLVGKYFELIQKQKISITNIMIFLKKLLQKMDEIKQRFNKQMLISQQDIQTKFIQQVAIQVCQQKCPCCDRICGKQKNHIDPHQCVFGHQIRAFGGIKFENGNASVQRCENMTDTSKLKYNGRVTIWKQFKDQQAKRRWNFDDLQNSNTSRSNLFQYAWETVGQHFCSKYKMNYIKYNNSKDYGMVHFIFAIDESGSMNSPDKWPQVIRSLNRILPIIKNIPNFEISVRISILMLSDTCSVAQQNVSPNNVDFNLTANWGGTTFGPTFQTAYNLMLKYHKTSNIMFILLTDGGAQFPAQQIRLIKQLKAISSNKIMYSSIQFQCSGPVMIQISDELQGKNFSAYTQQQLFSAFQSSIELINDKSVK